MSALGRLYEAKVDEIRILVARESLEKRGHHLVDVSSQFATRQEPSAAGSSERLVKGRGADGLALSLLKIGTEVEPAGGVIGQQAVEQRELGADLNEVREDECHPLAGVEPVPQSSAAKHDPLTAIRDTSQFRVLGTAIADCLRDSLLCRGIAKHRARDFERCTRGTSLDAERPPISLRLHDQAETAVNAARVVREPSLSAGLGGDFRERPTQDLDQ
jgi:hypothetical protein